MRLYMATRLLMLVNRTYEEKGKQKGERRARFSGRDKREESKVAYGGNDMAISDLNKAKVEKVKSTVILMLPTNLLLLLIPILVLILLLMLRLNIPESWTKD